MERYTGQRNLYVIGKYKDYILDKLSRNKDFQLAVLGYEVEETDETDYEEIFDEYLYGYAFSEDAADINKVYVCIDITVPYTDGTTFKDLYIYAYVFAPKNFVKWKKDNPDEQDVREQLEARGYCGNKIDMITDIIDRELNGNKDMTIGKLTYANKDPVTIFNAQQGSYGKLITYYGCDFNVPSDSLIRHDYKDGELDYEG